MAISWVIHTKWKLIAGRIIGYENHPIIDVSMGHPLYRWCLKEKNIELPRVAFSMFDYNSAKV